MPATGLRRPTVTNACACSTPVSLLQKKGSHGASGARQGCSTL